MSKIDFGKGFDFWKTIPTRRRRSTTSWSGRYTDSPSRTRSPSWRTFGMRSFIRLIERRKVDFPHPEGPMSAVTFLFGTPRSTSSSACVVPYQKEKPRASSCITSPAAPAARASCIVILLCTGS